jgi:hypothetical protein
MGKRALRFVRCLLPDGEARVTGASFVAARDGRQATLPVAEVRDLIASGVLDGDAIACRARPEAAQWLKRAMLEADAFAAQHRVAAPGPDGTTLNLAESPLARLAFAAAGESDAFLSRHQVEAGERVRRLAERARLQPRVTMSYSAAHVAAKGAGHAAEIGDLVADAKRQLAEIHAVLPRDCAGVVMDVCGLLKGLQLVEAERGWPRRSAKLVLRIGLDRLAEVWGIGAVAVGRESGRAKKWMGGERPPL